MKLSVIIPALNEEQNIQVLLASLAAQTFRDFEVIVADANSVDRTRAIAASFGAKVVAGGMPGPGRNRGAEAATGELLLFLDADIVLPHAHFLEQMLVAYQSCGNATATCDLIVPNGNRADRLCMAGYNRYVRRTARVLPHAPGFFILTRRETHRAISGFDEAVVFAEDHDYVRRAARVGGFSILNGVEIPMSLRRFEKDGRVRTALKYAFAEFYMIFFGSIKKDLFKYEFGYVPKNK